MHFHHALLVEATDEDEAKSAAESFLEPYGEGNVWDWYATTESDRFAFDLGKNKTAFTVNAENPKFFDIIKTHEGYGDNELKRLEEMLKNKYETLAVMLFNTTDSMDLYYIKKWAELKSGDIYNGDSYFYDTVGYCSHLTDDRKKEILKNPKGYWLVSCDLHN